MARRTTGWLKFNKAMGNARPWPGPQRLKNIDGLLTTQGLVHLEIQYPILGRLHLGEPGDSSPYAICDCFADGSGYIVISGGLLDFVEAVHSVLVKGGSLRHPQGARVQAEMTPAEVDEALLSLYTAWRSLKGADTRLVTNANLCKAHQDYFDKRYLATRVFILMHERGHAALHSALKPEEMGPEHELEADAFALDAMLHFRPPGVDFETLIAGATIVPRIYRALEIMGYTFRETHPSPEVRMAALFDRVRSVATTEFEYYGLTGHARVQDLRMDATERKLAGGDVDSNRFSAEHVIFSVTSGARGAVADPPWCTIDNARDNAMSYIARSDARSLAKIEGLWKRIEGSVYPKTDMAQSAYFTRCMQAARQIIVSLPENDRRHFGST